MQKMVNLNDDLLIYAGYSASLGLTIINNCKDVVWPGILSATGTLSSTGFALQPRDSHTFYVSSNWAGRIWGRTQCSYNFTHLFSCVTADCGSSTIQCNGLPTPPVTLAEFTLKGTSGIHDYDVSLVHGFNLPMWVEPHTNSGDRKCMETGCDKNLIEACPEELKVIREGKRVGCKRMACQAPSCLDSQFYKAECPRAHVYSNDHASCTCSASHFTITFCPNR
ncbi:Thaumatin protein 1a [Spatholobus suberectus]|nr:Thaumatin protein 1a [Spatholobus suberectus]